MKDVLKMRVLFVFIGVVLQVLTGVFTSYCLQGNIHQSMIVGISGILFILYYMIVLSLGE